MFWDLITTDCSASSKIMPVAVQVAGLFLIVTLGILYWWLIRRTGREQDKFRKTVLGGFILIILFHTILDCKVLLDITVGVKGYVNTFVIALFHSLELFMFQTHLFDNGYQEYLFGESSNLLWLNANGKPVLVFLYVLAFVLATETSLCFIIRIFSRKDAGRTWLRDNQDKPVSVFFGGELRAKFLAEDLKLTKPDPRLLYVADYDPETENIGLSVWDIIKYKLFKRKTENFEPFDAVVFAKVPLKDVEGENICAQMGLELLSRILENNACEVYLLSDDYNANLQCAGILQKAGCKAKIFCRACREGVNRMYEETLSMTPNVTVHLVDESYLAVRELLDQSHKELLPVNFVDKGKDTIGKLEGWVDSPFNSMILGFGELGQEALGFLYEYGAFVGRDFKRSPFSCTVLDKNMDILEKAFCVRYPGMGENSGVIYNKCEVGSNDFWTKMKSLILDLNYIVICLGDDRLNLQVASEILNLALRENKDLTHNFAILVAQQNPDYLNEITVKHLNSIAQYHKCVHAFGELKSVWRYQVISNSTLDDKARNYYASYEKAASGKDVDKDVLWEKREDAILSSEDYKERMNCIRKRSQDYANVLHANTKFALLGSEIFDCRKDIANQIPEMVNLSSKHYSGVDKHVEQVLHYLAVLEHIRWEASHVAMGYVPGPETDAVKKTHKYITPFEKLDDKTKHYDYLVVRTTFLLF